LTLGFSEEMRQELLQQYLQHRREIRDILNEMAMDLPHYHNLEWRFDVQVGLQNNPEIVYTCFFPIHSNLSTCFCFTRYGTNQSAVIKQGLGLWVSNDELFQDSMPRLVVQTVQYLDRYCNETVLYS